MQTVPNGRLVTDGTAVDRRTVYILDDDEAVRLSLAFFLTSSGFCPRSFASSDAFIAEADDLAPGCVLLDVRMPELDGFQVLGRIEDKRASLPVVMMTGHGDVMTAVRSMKLGACDFIEKPYQEDQLLEILRSVFAKLGDSISSLRHRNHFLTRLGRLTRREREVLRAVSAGRANKLIAHELNISVRTVEMHRAAMMERLGARTSAEAIRMAIEGGIARSLDPENLVA